MRQNRPAISGQNSLALTDSGYDDAYAQTREYIDWIEEDVAVKGQRVFGIICLNDPTKDLIEKVKADDQMRLFEYSISYSEII